MSQQKEYEKYLKEGQKLNVKEIKSRLFQMDVDFDVNKNQKKYFVEIYDKKIKENVCRDKISDRLRKDYEEQKNEMKRRFWIEDVDVGCWSKKEEGFAYLQCGIIFV